MFFLTGDSISKMLDKKQSLFDTASGTTSTSSKSFIRLDLKNNLTIVRCVDVTGCSNEDLNLISILISDGITSHRVYCDLDNCESNLRDISSQLDHQLDAGCFILIYEYSFVKLRELFKNNILPGDEINYDLDEHVICINNYVIIGHDESQDIERSITSSQKLLEDLDLKKEFTFPSLDKDVIPRHIIDNIRIDLSSSAWSIKCKLIEKSLKLSFIYRDTFREGFKMRTLWFDGYKHIECIAFDDMISKLELLQLDKIYLIDNANVSMSKLTFKSWPNQIDSVFEYDLVVKKETNFILLTNGSLKQKTDLIKDQPTTSRNVENIKIESKINIRKQTTKESDEDNSENSSQNFVIKKNEETSLQRVGDFKSNEFNSIAEIHKMLSNKQVNVIGIIHHIYELKEVSSSYGNPLSLLNIEIIDKSKYPIRVTLWGKEAEQFNNKIGDCILFKNIKTNLYQNKMTLSKTKDCSMINMNTNLKSKLVSDLKQWYSEFILSNESKYETKRKTRESEKHDEGIKKFKKL